MRHPDWKLHAAQQARFWSRVRFDHDCWLWTGSINYSEGYGRFGHDGHLAHRLAYEITFGPIGDLVIDHLCRNRLCVNPTHMEPVASRENTLRGVNFVAKQAAQTHCHRGHPLSGDNLRVKDGERTCRICANATQRARMKRLRAAARALLASPGAPRATTTSTPRS